MQFCVFRRVYKHVYDLQVDSLDGVALPKCGHTHKEKEFALGLAYLKKINNSPIKGTKVK